MHTRTCRRYQDEINNRPCKFNYWLLFYFCSLLRFETNSLSPSSLSSPNRHSNQKFLSSAQHLQHHSRSQCHKHNSWRQVCMILKRPRAEYNNYVIIHVHPEHFCNYNNIIIIIIQSHRATVERIINTPAGLLSERLLWDRNMSRFIRYMYIHVHACTCMYIHVVL